MGRLRVGISVEGSLEAQQTPDFTPEYQRYGLCPGDEIDIGSRVWKFQLPLQPVRLMHREEPSY